jgi:hypothetical protein
MLVITDLPPQLVPAVTALAQRLSSHIRSHRDASLEVHEQGVLEAWRAEGAAVLGRRGDCGDDGRGPRGTRTTQCVPALRSWPSSRSWHQRTVETQLGGLTFMRTRYRCGACHQRWVGPLGGGRGGTHHVS